MFNDDELVKKIRHGDEQAAEELINRYYTSILRYCKWHCSSLEKAEDLTQETFYRLFKNLSGYNGKQKAKQPHPQRREIKDAPTIADAPLIRGNKYIDGIKIGVIIDRIERVVQVKNEEIKPPPQMLTGIGTEYIHGVIRQDNGYLIILDIRRVFNPKDLQKLVGADV